MLKKFSIFTAIIITLLSQILVRGTVNSAAGNPRIYNERAAIRSLVQLIGAQATYNATTGNGNFGTFADLLRASLIDPALASGNKYGYTFVMSLTPRSTNSPSRFNVTATPQRYLKTGRRSFYQDESGEVRGGDKNGGLATPADPYIDSCAFWGAADNERCTIQDLRTLHGAEMTYASSYGSGSFATLARLGEGSLINRTLATGLIHGYSFTVTFVTQTQTVPASFRITAVPRTYGTTGIRSFFIATDGIIYCADKNGAPADENDPPCNQ